MKKAGYIVLLACLLAVFAGCHRRPLHEMEERITLKVTVDVDTVCNIGRYIYNDKIAQPSTNTDMLRVFIIDPKTGKKIGEKFLENKTYDAAGHQVFTDYLNISYGTFDFLIYNFDTANTLIKDENEENTVLAYTQELTQAERNAVTGSESSVLGNSMLSWQPDHLMVAREQNVYIAPHTEMENVETVAHTCINTYYIQIRVDGLRFVRSANAVITGLYSANYFGRDAVSPWTVGERVGNPSTAVFFEMVKSTDDNITDDNKDVICALFNTFGKIENSNSDLLVTFTLIDIEGNRLQKTVNLNEVFRTEDALVRHWLLIDGIWEIDDPVPHPVNGGGFVPYVDDWDEEYGEIEL